MPCAGCGRRLGLTTPKELFKISDTTRLIDFSISHIRAALGRVDVKVVVVIRPHKKEVAEHVRLQLPGVEVEAVMFDDSLREWPGSVYSARGLFSGANLVLLPDSLLNVGRGRLADMPICEDGSGFTLVDLMAAALERHEVVFGCVECSEPGILKNLGALRIEDGLVTAFQDKPKDSFELYNGYWGCFAFREGAAESLYGFLDSSVFHRPVSFREQSFYPAGAVILDSYRDFGNWEAVEQYRRQVGGVPSQ